MGRLNANDFPTKTVCATSRNAGMLKKPRKFKYRHALVIGDCHKNSTQVKKQFS